MLPGADTALVQVCVNIEAEVDTVNSYDVAEYKQVEDDGTIPLNIDADAARAGRSEMGFRIGRTIEDAKTRAGATAERDAARGRGASPSTSPRRACRGGIKLEGKSVVPTPGETVIQRANKFTNYAGTFLYVEAHNKATSARSRANNVHRPGR